MKFWGCFGQHSWVNDYAVKQVVTRFQVLRQESPGATLRMEWYCHAKDED
jgi:hypothetical protein